MQDLIQDFIAETRETLEAIQDELIAWEQDPADRGRLESIFRFFHTVKGSCGFLDLPRLTRLSHAAEDALDCVRDGKRQPDKALVDAVLALADRIAAIVAAMESGGSIDDSDDERLIGAVSAPPAERRVRPRSVSAEPVGDAAAPAAARAESVSQANYSVRVPIHLLDQLMSGVSDLVLARNELSRQLRQTGSAGQAEAAFEQLSGHVAQLREAIGGMRMQRIDRLFAPLNRLVRDIGSELGKPLRLEVEGGEVEIDREMIDLVRDPLTHLIRNAADHGIEPAGQRLSVGKPAHGLIRISARQIGNHVIIEVADDGRGIDVDRLVAKAIAARVTTLADVGKLDARGKLALVFRPGLSTAESVSTISGRGVGMDVVRTRIEATGGSVDIDNAPGRGLTVKLHVPLTLSIITGLILRTGDQVFAISQASVDEIIRVGADGVRIAEVAGAAIAEIRGRIIPLVQLDALLGLAEPQPKAQRSLVVVNAGPSGPFVLEVGEVLDSEELVVKPAVPAVLATGLYAGMSLPDSGTPMLLLDASSIAAVAGVTPELTGRVPHPAAMPSGEAASTIMLFRSMDGEVRAIRLDAIERVEELPSSRVQRIEGRWRVADGARHGLVLDADEAMQSDGAVVRTLRLCDGDTLRFLAIREAIDIVVVDTPVDPPLAPGRIEGIVEVAGRQVELIDPFWLFEEGRVRTPKAPARRSCHIVAAPHDGWSRTVLRPLLARAGYAVSCGPDDGGTADMVIAPEDVPVNAGNRPVVRLGRAGGTGEIAVERYDRDGILAALDQAACGGTRR